MGAICGCCKPKPAEPTRQTVHVREYGEKVQVSEGMDTDVISGDGTALADCKVDQDAAYWEAVIKALPKDGQCCIGVAQKNISLDAVIAVAPGGLPTSEPQASKAADDGAADPSVIGAQSNGPKDNLAFAISAAAGLEEGDVIGVAFGFVDQPHLRFYQNGKLMSSATVMKVQGQVKPAFSVAGGAQLGVIFDEDSFRSTPPSGYTELIKVAQNAPRCDYSDPACAEWFEKKASKGFVVGASAGMMATSCIQPVDMVKVRIQLGAAEGLSTSPIEITRNMLKEEGVGAFYKGLTAGLTRQVVYTGARLGLYDEFTARIKSPEEKSLPFWKTAVCSLGAGGIAAVMGNPADLALIRMQADTMLPVAERRGYTNVFNALGGIVKESGAGGLFKGSAPTATRAMALNFGMLGFNTQAKSWLAQAGVTPGSSAQVFGASAIAGFFASVFSLPFDFVKTQVQKMKADPVTGEMPYKGPIDCALKQVREGGPLKLWSGFPTYYVRIAPHAMITLICQDAIKKQLTAAGL